MTSSPLETPRAIQRRPLCYISCLLRGWYNSPFYSFTASLFVLLPPLSVPSSIYATCQAERFVM